MPSGGPRAPTGTMTRLEGPQGTAAVQATLGRPETVAFTQHLTALGYRRADANMGAAVLSSGGYEDTQVCIPFEKDQHHWAFVLHTSNIHGRHKLICCEADTTRLATIGASDQERTRESARKPDGTADVGVLERAGLIPRGPQWIYVNGQVLQGTTCDFWGCWWPHIYWCCGASAISCILSGPAWWICMSLRCGGCMVLTHFWCGCLSL